MIGHAFLQLRLRCPHCSHVETVLKLGVRFGNPRTCPRCHRTYTLSPERVVELPPR